MKKENSDRRGSVVLSNGELTNCPRLHLEIPTRAIGYKVNGEKYLGEKKENEMKIKELSPETKAIFYLASTMGSFLSSKNKIAASLEVKDDTKPYLFGNFIKKEAFNFRRNGSYNLHEYGSIFLPESGKMNLVSRTINLEEINRKRELERKRELAEKERTTILQNLSKFCIDEINEDLLGRGESSLSKKMNEINNIKKKRI